MTRQRIGRQEKTTSGLRGSVWTSQAVIAAVITVVATGMLLLLLVPYHMFYHDEGQYGESAVRILRGELPHRDFHELYTGALSYLHAAVFAVAGKQLVALRYAMVVASLPAVLAMYDIVLRLTKRIEWAALVSCSSFVVSAGMTHSAWANLYLSFLTILVTWAVFRYAAASHWYWVLAAGLFAGMAVAVKVTGLFTIAGAGLAITFCGTSCAARADANAAAARWEWLIRVGVAALGCIAVVLLIQPQFSLDACLYYVLPVFLLAIVLVRFGCGFRTANLILTYLIFGAGVLIPLGVLLIPWIMAGALPDFLHGIFVLPRLRLAAAAYPPPTFLGLAWALPAAACFVCFTDRRRGSLSWIGLTSLILLLLVGLMDASKSAFRTAPILAAMASWRWLLPWILAILAWRLPEIANGRPALAAQLFATASSAVFYCLNQFPFAQPFYFLFCFPHIALAGVALCCASESEPSAAQRTDMPPRLAGLPGLFAVIAFCVFCLLRFGLDGVFGEFYTRIQGAGRVDVLSGIVVPEGDAAQYDNLIEVLNTVVNKNQTVLAGPDCPEVYFLSGRKNLTPLVFDIFATGKDHEAKMLAIAKRDDVTAIVINQIPQFSTPWSEELCRTMGELCEVDVRIGKFIVLLKHAPGPRRTTLPPHQDRATSDIQRSK